MHVYKTVKDITKTDILGSIIQRIAHVIFYRKNMQACFKLDEGEKKQNKKHITYLAFTTLEYEC